MFLNYVITKYFMFAVFTILRIPDICSTIVFSIFRTDMLYKALTYKYKAFDFITSLCYITHMLVIGLMYSVVSPITMVIIFLALICLTFVTRYNILFVHQQYPICDLSNDQDLLITILNNIFFGIVLMITAVFSYVVVGMHSSIAILVAILLINYVYIFVEKIRIDQKFKRSLSQLKLGAYEPPGLTQNPFLD